MTSLVCMTSIANILEEDFKERALAQAIHKPLCWFCYVDVMLFIWPHGPQKLQRFPDHMNSIHRNIQFTMETGWPPSFSWYNYRRPNGSLGRKIYEKPTVDHITSLRTNKPFLQTWCTGPGLCLTRKASMMSLNSFIPFSGKTGTVWSRSDMPSTQQWKLPSPNICPPQLLSCHLSRWHTATLAECWPNTTSRV